MSEESLDSNSLEYLVASAISEASSAAALRNGRIRRIVIHARVYGRTSNGRLFVMSPWERIENFDQSSVVSIEIERKKTPTARRFWEWIRGGGQMKGLSRLMSRHKDTLAKLADLFDVNINTVWRWKSGHNAPTLDVQRTLCERYGCTIDELLNGPQADVYKVTLKFVKTLEGVSEEMNTDGIALIIADDGFIGVSGGRKFESDEDIERVVSEVRRKLTFGLEHRDEIRGGGEGHKS
jgi:transcriptional regulator with XRE-family HTH domain